jgi:hypothetical protein
MQRGWFLRLVSVLIMIGFAGCAGIPKQSSSTNLSGVYRFGTFVAELPPEARVPAVIAAAEETLVARGYSVEGVSATEEAGRLIARPPRTTDFPRLKFVARLYRSKTRVEVSFMPVSDEALCRSVLDGTLQRLGL